MVSTAQRAAPTVADANRAAASLCEIFDPAMVLLYGSVARGEQTRESDLDLIAVFDDLGDYSTRRELAGRAADAVRTATGFDADVRVTDLAEWEIRTTRCRSTFEAYLAAHAVTLAVREPHVPVDLNKEIGMPPSDGAEAASALTNTTQALNLIKALLEPTNYEWVASDADDHVNSSKMRRARLLGQCAQAQATMETALKGLIHALEGPSPDRTHNIGDLLETARGFVIAAGRLDDLLGDITPEDASLWRETATYVADSNLQHHADKATVEFTTEMIHAATRTATRCVELITLALDEYPPVCDDISELCDTIENYLAAHTLADYFIPQPDTGIGL